MNIELQNELTQKQQEADFQSAYEESGLNGRAINWRYWVHQMPKLNAFQAACLMAALDPRVFENLNGKPGNDDPTRNIEKAKDIQLLAEAEGKLTASPAEWVEWAQSHKLNVHTGFLLAVWELPEENSNHTPKGKAETVKPPVPAIKGVDKRKVQAAFQNIKWDYDHWGKNLASPSDKLKACRIAPGSKKASALWNPVDIALYLLDESIKRKTLDAVFVRLPDWADEWREKTTLEPD